MKFKKLSTLALIGVLSISSLSLSFAQANEDIMLISEPIAINAQAQYKITVNGNEIDLGATQTFNEKEHIMIPVRPIAQILGYEVKWNEDTKSIDLVREKDTVSIKSEKDEYTNQKNEHVSLGMQAKNVDGTTYVPIEFFTQILNLDAKFGNGYIFFATKVEALNMQGKIEEVRIEDKINQVVVKSFDGQNTIVFNVNEDTKLVDPLTDNVLKISDLKKDDEVNVYYSPMMTRSLPPISNAFTIEVTNTTAVSTGTIDSVDLENKGITINTKTDVKPEEKIYSQTIIHLSDETQIVDSSGKKIKLQLEDLKEGMKVKVYHSKVMTMSIPGQTSGVKIVVEYN